MSEKKIVELTSPDGKRTWSTANPSELTNLRARGWSEKPAADVEPPADRGSALAGAAPADKAIISKPRK